VLEETQTRGSDLDSLVIERHVVDRALRDGRVVAQS
jgi:hypothetical protein